MRLALSMTFLTVFLSLVFVPALTTTVHASNVEACRGSTNLLSFPAWYQYLEVSPPPDCTVSAIRYDDGPGLGGESEPPVNIGATVGALLLAIIEILLRVAGIVAVGFVVYGGIRYTMSQGAPDKLQAARQTIINGIIGIFIAASAVAIINLVSDILI